MKILCLLMLASDWLDQGAQLEAAHRWDEASRLYESALSSSEAAAHDVRFWLLTSLAEVEFNRREYARSERWLKQAVPSTPPERARLLTASGTLHLVTGNLAAAERELSQAMSIAISPEDRAAALHNFAAVEMRLNRLDAAELHETEALRLYRQRLGERHEYVLKAWISLSSVQGLRGNWRAAEISLRHALAIGDSEEALSNYAVVLDHLKRGREASEIRRHLRLTLRPSSEVDVHSLVERRRPDILTR